MNKTRIIQYCLSISMLFFCATVMAQKNALVSADQAFHDKEYFDAIELYKKAYTDLKGPKAKQEKGRIIFQIAECYRMMDQPREEEQWYYKAIRAHYDDPNAYLYLADAQKMQGNYDSAINNYTRFKALVPSNPMGDIGIKSCKTAAELKNNPTRYQVDNMHQLNTKWDDFAACYSDRREDEIIFTSARQGSMGDIDNGTGQTFTDLYITKQDRNGKWSVPVALPAPINTGANEGTPTMDRRFRTLYFTRCTVVKGTQQNCKIFSSDRRGASWADPVKLAFQIDSVTYGHPTLSADGQELFFSSNLSGGYGKLDIWVSHYDRKTRGWGDPVNLGPDINTAGDEVFPYIHPDGTLYFSSDGLPGMGGLDIFAAKKEGKDKWGTPTNMGVPINSEGDDFAITFTNNKERGIFTSTRQGGRGNCDLYSFNLPPLLFELKGQVVDNKTKKGIHLATVHLVGSDGSDVSLKTDTGGYYDFGINGKDRYIKPNTSYIATAGASDLQYLNSDEKANETTVGLTESKTFIHNFELQKADIHVELHFPQVLYDLDKATLTENSKDSLNYLVTLLNNNPTIKIELDANTDQRGSKRHNEILSQARAQSCVAYLISKGIDSARLVPKGWGFDRPIITSAQIAKMKTKQEKEAAWQVNRRTSFHVLSFDYVPKGHVMTAQDSLKMKALQKAKVTGETQATDTSSDEGVPIPQAPAPPAQGQPGGNNSGGNTNQKPDGTAKPKQ